MHTGVLENVLLCALCGLLFRIRGGGIVNLGSTTAARLVAWAIPFSLILSYATGNLNNWNFLYLIPAVFLGIVWRWGEIYDIGTRDGKKGADMQYFTWRGNTLFGCGVIQWIYYFHSPEVAIWMAFAAMGLCLSLPYYLAWHVLPRFSRIGTTEVAEFMAGAFIFAGFWCINEIIL